MNELIKNIFIKSRVTTLTDSLRAKNVNSLLIKFNADKSKYMNFIEGYEKELESYFIRSIILILIYLEPDRIKFSFTDSHSIFFQIFVGNFQVKLEIFYTKDYEGDIQDAAYTIYRYEELIARNIDKLDVAIQEIKTVLTSDTKNNTSIVNDSTFSTINNFNSVFNPTF